MLEDSLINNINKEEFSVSEISTRIKQLLENKFSLIKIKGEISGLKIATSGHGYFSLRDDKAIISATCWRHNLSRLKFKIEEGLEVIAIGKITAYSGQSKYQITVENIEPAGDGAFLKILQERRKKLEQEGLFDQKYKKPLPYIPKVIGIITSPTGAVIKDIIHRITDRCYTKLIIWPVSVQGKSSANEVVTAINGFNQLDTDLRPDLLIVARGGGSIEDLWSFNDEEVVRATFHSFIPIISAIGHETDYTLIDFAADVRAPTPTAAAEFAVPVASDLKYKLNMLGRRLETRLQERLKFYSQVLSSHQRVLEQVENLTFHYTQTLDNFSFYLSASLPNLLKQKYNMLKYFPISRIKPIKLLKYKYLQYEQYSSFILSQSDTAFNEYEYKLQLNSSLLHSLDYNNVLRRGFAMVRNIQGRYLSTYKEISKNTKITIKMSDGEIEAKL